MARPRVLTVNGPSLAEYEAPDLETSTGPRLPTFSTNPKESTFATEAAPHLVALVQAGAKFDKGKLVEREPATRDVEAPKTTVEAA